jgi:ribonuclease HII
MLKPFLEENRLEAGCDEAGRGCLAGPVFAAAVILDANCQIKQLNDSKLLSRKQRLELKIEIESKALAFSVQMVEQEEIDSINILNASIKAMHLSVAALKIKPEFLLIDGNRFKPYPNIPHSCIVKGDSKFMSIAAASILAKTYRDEYMEKLAELFPNYLWSKNKGYPTLEHRNAIEKHGITPHHRRSFKLTNNQLEIQFYEKE